MTDLCERLKQAAQIAERDSKLHVSRHDNLQASLFAWHAELHRQAADEIFRLRAIEDIACTERSRSVDRRRT
jgi:hypothetical protein